MVEQSSEQQFAVRADSRRASLWLSLNTVLMKVAGLATTVVVARILSPSDFGVFSLTLVVYAVLSSFAELGVAAALARHDLDPEDIARSIVTISLVSGTVLGVSMFLFAEQLAGLLGTQEAATPIRIMSACVMMNGLFAVPATQLQRDFRQRALFFSAIASFAISTPILIGLAVVTGGAEAFAWSRVFGQIAQGIVIVTAVKKHYRPGWNRAVVPMLLIFGLPIAGANLLSQVVANVDYVIISANLGVVAVGIYTIAFNVASLPVSIIGSVLHGLVMPAFSRVRFEGGNMATALASAVRTVALIAAPLGAGIAALSEPLIRVVYGAKWISAAPVLSVLCAFGVLSVLSILLMGVLYSSGKTTSVLIVQVANLIVVVPLMLLWIPRFGLLGIAFAHVAVVLVITLGGYLLTMRRLFPSSTRAFFKGAVWPIFAAGVAGLVVKLLLPVLGADWTSLALGGVAGLLIYLLLVAPLLWPHVRVWKLRRSPRSSENAGPRQ